MYSIVIWGLWRPYQGFSALDTLKEVGVHPSRMYPHLFVLSLSIRASHARERNKRVRLGAEGGAEPSTRVREKLPGKGGGGVVSLCVDGQAITRLRWPSTMCL